MDTPRTSLRAAALLIGVLALSLLSCGREITAPVSSPVNLFRRLAPFAFDAQYETAIKGPELRAALSQVAFERVRVTLRREDGSIALDTVVEFPAGAESLTLALSVPLAASAPASGVPLNLNLGYVNAAGDTVFKGGPIPMTVVPSTRNGEPPPPVQVPVQYTGTGANATRVAISPKSANGVGGQSTTFTAQALGATGTAIAGTPIVFTSSNPAVVRIADPSSGAASFVGRGTARVIAQLLTGPADTATVAVTLPAARLELASGGGQEAAAGTALPAAVRARVVASDGVGVGGVAVTFAVRDGGTVSPAAAVSAADGSVSASWTLGLPSGTQRMTVTSAGLAGSPLTVPATALIIPATQLAVTAMPSAGVAGAALSTVTVAALDANGNLVPTFNGDVRVALASNPGNATISGITTVEAVRGVATFTGLSLNRPGSGYTFTFSSGALREATSGGFSIAAGPAATLVMDALPASVTAGTALAATQVQALDALGNVATGFTGSVTVALAGGPAGAALAGATTQNATAGVATFSGLTITKVGTGYALTATAGTLPPITSGTFAVTPGAPKTLEIVSGADQSAVVGTRLAAISVRLLDTWGNAIPGKSVALAVTRGGGTVAPALATTDASGLANVTWTLGGPAGTQTLTATVSGVPALTINATGLTGPAVRLAADSGAAQSGIVGSQFAQDLVVLVTDSYGNPVKDKTVTWRLAVGSGTLGATTSVTDDNGRARTSFTLPTSPGLSIVQATVTGLVAANFTAT
ncbi:MAG: Ig-like domain-containing protein, partial [Gemmatimonadota bacterium]|nr:Ig-like domain-containing protein [Gemmatimonadota bacterium]